jgi:hypothetical protein
MAVLIFCSRCRHRFEAVGELPKTCPDCEKETVWVTAAVAVADHRPLEFGQDDRAFLKQLWIRAE